VDEASTQLAAGGLSLTFVKTQKNNMLKVDFTQAHVDATEGSVIMWLFMCDCQI